MHKRCIVCWLSLCGRRAVVCARLQHTMQSIYNICWLKRLPSRRNSPPLPSFPYHSPRSQHLVVPPSASSALICLGWLLKHDSKKSDYSVTRLVLPQYICQLFASRDFQCSPTLNRQSYRRKAATDKLMEKIVKHDSWPIQPSILNHDWHPGSRCGWTCNQLTSKVNGDITGSRLRWSTPTLCVTPQSSNRILTSLGNSDLYWTVFARNRDTTVPAEWNGDLPTLICVPVARPRRYPTLSNPVPSQNWMAAYLGYTLRMMTMFRGWPIMVYNTHMRRRIIIINERIMVAQSQKITRTPHKKTKETRVTARKYCHAQAKLPE